MAYHARVVDQELADALASVGAVVVEGPRACGKTETARQVAAAEVRLDVDPGARDAFLLDPRLILDRPAPLLLDEWQLEPTIWNHVRRAVDDRRATGQFILTGSSVPRDDVTRHAGAGRFAHLQMRPMTLAEAGHSTRTISLASVLSGEAVAVPDPGLTVRDLAELLAIGGWPLHLGWNADRAQRALRSYLQEIANVDITRLDGIRRDPGSVTRLLVSLGRHVGTPASIATITADTNGADGSVKPDTVKTYLDALERLMVVEDLPAWQPALRSRTRLRSTPVRHLCDPSLALAALRARPAHLLADLRWFGFLFESLVIRDLRVGAQTIGAQLFHYRDGTDLEADAIVELPDGGWAAFEVKLAAAPAVVDAAAANLIRLRERIAGEPPRALAVITGTGYGLTRRDGVLQIPIGALTA